jgi:hypothetical protein
VELLTSREKMRECIQYLQSLRAIVDNPPVTPTRTLAKTKAPSIDKVICLRCTSCEQRRTVFCFGRW